MESWSAPFRVTDGERLVAAVREARLQAGPRICRASFVIDHRNLLFHVQETPPVRGILLDRMLDRLVAESRFFEEPAVWASLALPGEGTRHRWLLALLTRSVFDDIQTACDENDLELIGIRPIAAVLAGPLKRLGAESGEAVLLVADFGSSYGLLAGRGDGQVLFVRSIAGGRGDDAGRLDQEINRTLQFVLQRFGGRVDRMVVIGERTHSVLAGRRIRDGLRVECLSEGSDGAVSVTGIAGPAEPTVLDFTKGRRRSPLWVRPALAAALALLLVVSSGVAALSLMEWKSRVVEKAEVEREARAAQRIAASRNARQSEANRLRALVETVGGDGGTAMVPAFGRYLPTVLPESFRLSRLAIDRSTNGWHVQLQGVSRDLGSRFLGRVESWEEALRNGAFRMEILDSTHRRSVKEASDLEAASFGGASVSASPRGEERTFFVKGWIP